MIYYNYITINLKEPTKAYVGMTKNPIESGYKGSGRIIISAMKKYGSENFQRVDIGEYESSDETHYWEGFYIKILKTHVSEGGYNISPKGGQGRYGDNVSAETKKKISEGLKGRHPSEETRKKLSENNGRGMLGKQHTEDAKEKNKQSHKGKIYSDEINKKKGIGTIGKTYEEIFGSVDKANERRKKCAWNKGLTYKTNKSPWNKGKEHSVETRKKMSDSHKGIKMKIK